MLRKTKSVDFFEWGNEERSMDRLRRTALQEYWPSIKTEAAISTFVPFRIERDALGRLLSTTSQPLHQATVFKSSDFSRNLQTKKVDKVRNPKRKLIRKMPSTVPPVGTYCARDAWIKKSFQVPIHKHTKSQTSLLQSPVSLQGDLSDSNPNTPIRIQFHNPIFGQIRPKKKQTSSPKSSNTIPKHGFSELQLIGNPSEIRQWLSFRDQISQRNECMGRFKSLSSAMIRN